MFNTVLVANRGEIAVRVIRTLRRLGIRSVAVYSDADVGAPHVALADTALRLGPAPSARSYLDIDAVLGACRASGAQAVHPGYGFLSENVDFARALEDAGITFIGPPVHAINLMGDKIRSKNHVAGHGVPVTPGIAEPGMDDAALIAAAARVGFPLLIKPSAGGGGKGMVEVTDASDLSEALASARRTARSAFGDDTLFLERLVQSPRHIEVQVMADAHGNVVHLGERECSLQRRHQKVIEEAPAPLLEALPGGAALRERLGQAAVDAARSVDYVGAGTVEFLVSDRDPDDFFFMEMNTRLQVEHPVTEQVVRVHGQALDLVELQVRLAAGQPLGFTQQDVTLHGHAIEARLYAEDPGDGFTPSTGTVLAVREPSGEHVRLDSGLRTGLEISPYYDPMLAKLIGWGEDRAAALGVLDRALGETCVLGVRTNIEYLRALLADERIVAGALDTTLLDRFHFVPADAGAPELAIAAHLSLPDARGPWGPDGWRAGAPRPVELRFEGHEPLSAVRDGQTTIVDSVAVRGADGLFQVGGQSLRVQHARAADGTLWLGRDGWSAPLRRMGRAELLAAQLQRQARAEGHFSPDVLAPMPGTVIAVRAADGDTVQAGQLLATIEAMKMEHQLLAPAAGTVRMGRLTAGDLVKAKQVIATIEMEDQ